MFIKFNAKATPNSVWSTWKAEFIEEISNEKVFIYDFLNEIKDCLADKNLSWQFNYVAAKIPSLERLSDMKIDKNTTINNIAVAYFNCNVSTNLLYDKQRTAAILIYNWIREKYCISKCNMPRITLQYFLISNLEDNPDDYMCSCICEGSAVPCGGYTKDAKNKCECGSLICDNCISYINKNNNTSYMACFNCNRVFSKPT